MVAERMWAAAAVLVDIYLELLIFCNRQSTQLQLALVALVALEMVDTRVAVDQALLLQG